MKTNVQHWLQCRGTNYAGSYTHSCYCVFPQTSSDVFIMTLVGHEQIDLYSVHKMSHNTFLSMECIVEAQLVSVLPVIHVYELSKLKLRAAHSWGNPHPAKEQTVSLQWQKSTLMCKMFLKRMHLLRPCIVIDLPAMWLLTASQHAMSKWLMPWSQKADFCHKMRIKAKHFCS